METESTQPIKISEVEFAKLHERILRYAQIKYGYVNAEDLAQEAMLKLVSKLDSIRDRSKLFSFLCKTLTRTAIERWRTDRVFSKVTSNRVDEIVVENATASAYTTDDLLDGIDLLDRADKILVCLRMEGASFRKIAGQLGVSEKTASTRYRKALAKLKRLLTLRAG